MTIEELKALAQRVMDTGIEQIRETGSLMQKFILAKRDGGLDYMVIGGDITNSESAKSALSQEIKKRIATGDVQAVIHLSDTWFAKITPENQRIKEKLHMNVEEAAAFGLCEKAEAVMVTLESPILNLIMQQAYERDGNKVTLVGSVVTADDTDGTFRSDPARFTGLFHAASAAGGKSRPT
jgi:Icc-related predicted phosphoesterase